MKIAVLGLGFMGSTHAQAWLQIPGAELAAVASRDPRRLSGDFTGVQGNLGGQGGKLDFSAVARYTSAAEAVLDPAVEAVDICLPTRLHERMTNGCWVSGFPHIQTVLVLTHSLSASMPPSRPRPLRL